MAKQRVNQRATAAVAFGCMVAFIVGVFVLVVTFSGDLEQDVRRRMEEETVDLRKRIEAAFGVQVQGKPREIALADDAEETFARLVIRSDEAGWVAAQLESAGFIAMEEMTLAAGDPPDWWEPNELAGRKQLGKLESVERSGGGSGGTVWAWWGTAGKDVVVYLRKIK